MYLYKKQLQYICFYNYFFFVIYSHILNRKSKMIQTTNQNNDNLSIDAGEAVSHHSTRFMSIHSHHTLKGVLGCIGGLFIHLIISSLYQWGTINIYITSYYKYTNDPQITLQDNAIIYPSMMICIGLTMRLGLILSKKIGSLPVLIVCNILCALTVFVSSFLPTFGGFIALYGILFGLFAGATFMIPIVQCNKFFPQKKMIVNGVILVGTGLGSVIFGTFSYNFINHDHQAPDHGYYLNEIALRVPACLRYLSLIYLIIGGLGTILLTPLIRYNEQYAKSHKIIQINEGQAQSIKQGVCSFVFWKKIAVLICCTCGIFLMTGNYKTYVKKQIHDDGFLTTIGAIGAVGNGFSRFLWSIIFKKTGYKFVMAINNLLGLCVLGSIRFAAAQTKEGYLFTIFLINCCLGGYLVITPIFSQILFGPTTGSNIYGFFWTTYSISNFLQFAFVSTLSYSISFDNVIYICMGMMLLGFPLIIFTQWKGPWENSTAELEYCQSSANKVQNIQHTQSIDNVSIQNQISGASAANNHSRKKSSIISKSVKESTHKQHEDSASELKRQITINTKLGPQRFAKDHPLPE